MIAGPDAFARHFDVSRETMARLEIYADLLGKWNPRINLVARSTLADLWTRHMQDSAQILEMSPKSSKTWVDLGSGGSFPGIVVGILASEKRPQPKVSLIESDQRKASFLRTVSRETGVSMEVISSRIEEAPPQRADVVSARALAPLPELLSLADRHLAPGGTAIFLKGANAAQEVAAAVETWRFHCETCPSQTDKDAVILKIGDIERV